MSEHVTHLGLFEDAARVTLHHPRMHEHFKQALRASWRAGCLGAITRSGDRFSIGLISKVRQSWESTGASRALEDKLAFLLGWRVHQAADRRFKNVFRELQPKHYQYPNPAPPDATVYHDVVVFREVYGYGRLAPFQPAALDYRLESNAFAKHAEPHFVEAILRSCWQQTLLRNQRFLANEKDPTAWQKLLEARIEPFTVDIRRYVDAHGNPDPGWYQRFIVAQNFYNPEDPLLRVARDLQHGKSVTEGVLLASLQDVDSQSQYAQALANGITYIHAANAYWNHEIDERELGRRFHIGSSHLETPAKESAP
ncbi:MAG: hypothetical protein MUF01_06235 [Bryobacterales bacterium]|jgi:hypothetical protein|nr:hypothetical protein [Bryobacterales bacterium]